MRAVGANLRSWFSIEAFGKGVLWFKCVTPVVG